MQVQILAVGKIKEKYLEAGIKEYLKRLSAYTKMEIHEVKDEHSAENASPAERQIVLAKEADRLEALIRPHTYLIALDIKGQQFSSPGFAAHLAQQTLMGKSHFTFLIGGSLGLSARLLERAELRLSFSPLTFPHQLFRLMLLEQLYRAFKINRGETYHK